MNIICQDLVQTSEVLVSIHMPVCLSRFYLILPVERHDHLQLVGWADK